MNEKIDQWQMGRGDQQRAGRSDQQRRTEEDEDISAEVQRVSRETIRARRDQRFLWCERDYFHSALVEIERGPHAQQKSRIQEHPTRGCCESRMKLTPSNQQIEASSDPRDAKTHQNDADIVNDAFK